MCRDVNQILEAADVEGQSAADSSGFPAKIDATSDSEASTNTFCMSGDSAPSTAPMTSSESSSIAERLNRVAVESKRKNRFGWSSERDAHSGRLWNNLDGHDLISNQIRTLANTDRPFQPYSAALCNLLDETPLLTPAAIASGDNLSPLQQVCANCWTITPLG
jgi:hypothetical protein